MGVYLIIIRVMISEILCSKHNKPVIFICTLEKCAQNYLICEQCKTSEAQHISTHVNFICPYKQFFSYQSNKSISEYLPKLEGGLTACENDLATYRHTSAQQLKAINEDFQRLKQIFAETEAKTRATIIDSYTNDMKKYDERLLALKTQIRDYIIERQQDRSFFGLFAKNEDIQASNTYQLIEKIITKNKAIFKLRADLLEFNNDIKKLPDRMPKYKQSERANERLSEIVIGWERDCKRTYAQFSDMFQEDQMRKSLVMEMRKSIASVSSNSNATYVNPLTQSTASITSISSKKSQRDETPPNLPTINFPALHPQISQILKSLQPIPSSNTGLKDQGPYQYRDGIYYGNFSKGMRHGKGIFLFNDGIYYDGFWMNDGMYSMGRLISKTYYYQGEVSDGKANGRGRMVDAEKEYDGQWVNDVKQGQGKLQYKNGKIKYIGQFQNNLFHGNGVLQTEEWKYQGAFWSGQRSGEGLMKYANGDTFKGKFRNGMKLCGRFTYGDGSYYDGTFENDLPHGNGVFQWPDGVRYEGTWVKGEQHGIGKEIYPDRTERKGEWDGGEWKRWL